MSDPELYQAFFVKIVSITNFKNHRKHRIGSVLVLQMVEPVCAEFDFLFSNVCFEYLYQCFCFNLDLPMYNVFDCNAADERLLLLLFEIHILHIEICNINIVFYNLVIHLHT